MGSPVTHFEVHGKDGEGLKKFYAEMFDWHVDSGNPMNYGLVDTHGGERGINGGITQRDEGPMVTFYVEVDDLQAALDKAEQLGGQTVMKPADVPGGPKLAMFTDPAGNVIGLAKGM
jgi:predicted enzyme related to lactoylglutathione lyase